MGPIFFLLFILDIGLSSVAAALIYVDDSKVSMPISKEEDVEIFQKELEIFYRWASINHMDFNSLEFVVLRYGPNEELKENTIYFSNDMLAPIDSLDTHKDLGVLMSRSGDFKEHIDLLSKK